MIPQQGLEEEAGLLLGFAARKQTRPGAANTQQLALQRLYPLLLYAYIEWQGKVIPRTDQTRY